jgi:protein dithiol:quinone oxidoreductase
MNTLPTFLKPRLVNLYLFLFCIALLGIALYMEHVMLLEPCPLCIMQRVFFLATALVSLVAAIHNPGPSGRKRYGLTAGVLALGGAFFASKQIYLQHLPADQVPACLPSVAYMFKADFPMKDILSTLFQGDGSCAEILWRDPLFNFFTIPDLSLIGLLMLAGVCFWQAVRKA